MMSDQCQQCKARGLPVMCHALECGFHNLWLVEYQEQRIRKLEAELARVRGQVENQAREEIACIISGRTSMFAEPIFDALSVATAIQGKLQRAIKAALEGKP